jgi:hypothetical protein
VTRHGPNTVEGARAGGSPAVVPGFMLGPNVM